MRSGLQLERARIHEKFAALVHDTIPDPGGRLTAAAATHGDAHQQLSRAVALDRIEMTARRARNRLRKLKGLLRLLDRTDHVCTSEVPCREERHRLIDPVVAELAKLAHRPAPARRRERMKIPPPTPKEIPMSDARTTGRVIDEPPEETARRAEADAARAANGQGAGLPAGLYPYLAHFDRLFRHPSAQPRPVLEHEAERLARAVLDYAPREQVAILTGIFFRLGLRSGR